MQLGLGQGKWDRRHNDRRRQIRNIPLSIAPVWDFYRTCILPVMRTPSSLPLHCTPGPRASHCHQWCKEVKVRLSSPLPTQAQSILFPMNVDKQEKNMDTLGATFAVIHAKISWLRHTENLRFIIKHSVVVKPPTVILLTPQEEMIPGSQVGHTKPESKFKEITSSYNAEFICGIHYPKTVGWGATGLDSVKRRLNKFIETRTAEVCN